MPGNPNPNHNPTPRFLQGPGTDMETVQELRRSITAGRPCVVQLLVRQWGGRGRGGAGEAHRQG